MRIAMYDDNRIGVVARDDTVVEVGDLLEQFSPLGPEDLLPDLISNFEKLKSELNARSERGGGTPVGDVKLNSPLTRPTKIVCLIGNYREGTDRPLQILDIFFKSPEGIVGDGDTVILPPHEASIFHHEAEIAVVIGQEAVNVSREQAMGHVFGYTVFNDVSARGLGRPGSASFLGKSFDTFAAFGPWVVTADDIDDPYALHVTVEDNGELRQNYSTSDMERPIDELISYISAVTPLHPGDVICCGTNHQGLGAMQDGDTVVTGVSGIGKFTLHVQDPQQREWERGVDQAMARQVIAMAQQPASGQGGSNA
jgi:2-keto-4-pentenoate hydratase/2-oxohepta-3-ene-1,7-dioic acid hydratase in catechol pathway